MGVGVIFKWDFPHNFLEGKQKKAVYKCRHILPTKNDFLGNTRDYERG